MLYVLETPESERELNVQNSYEAMIIFKSLNLETSEQSDITFPRIMKFRKTLLVNEVHAQLFKYFACLYDFCPIPALHARSYSTVVSLLLQLEKLGYRVKIIVNGFTTDFPLNKMKSLFFYA